jgi:hypothetical protein
MELKTTGKKDELFDFQIRVDPSGLTLFGILPP